MFDVYLSGKRDLLVVSRDYPLCALGRWRTSKKKVVKVSDEIEVGGSEARLLRAKVAGLAD